MAEPGIKPLLIEEEMKNSYLTYSLSVIRSRALPDAHDGLKPSQRRIMMAMNDLNLSPGAKFRKCAKIAGDTSGNYHPHGESVVYPTLVRLAQDWVMRYPLVIPQGNFGTLDGDPPAAMRYTEAKMSAIAMEMLEDLGSDTVDLRRNYDDTRDEPVVLPGKFPNLLCNGSSGIAVGMATSCPPHNLREVCDAMTHLIDNPDASIADLMEHIPGPDFPTGAEICGRLGIHDAYNTGKGKVRVRATTHEEEVRRKTAIVVDQVPYQVNKTALIEQIADLVKSGRLTGISDVRDESGRKEKVRVVIELKRGESADIVLNNLYKMTQLQTTYSLILMAVTGNQPETLNLRQMLQCYIDHRFVVIRRRTQYLLDKALARAHILEGLLKALDIIDEVIATIRASQTIADAKTNLQEQFEFSEIQADAIVRMTLGRLTGLERQRLQDELTELHTRIADYRDILARDERVFGIIKDDLAYLRDKFGDERRTILSGAAADLEMEDLIADENVVVTITHDDYIKRNSVSDYRVQKRGGTGIIGADMKEGDFINTLFIASTHQYILFFTNHGRLHWLKVFSVPEVGRTSKGRSVRNLINLEEEETISSVIPVREFDPERFVIFVTRRGLVKKTSLDQYSNVRKAGVRAIKLDEEDRLERVCICSPDQNIVIGTAEGKSIMFPGDEVRGMGRVAQGVIGIRLSREDRVVDMAVADDTMTLLTVTENGYGKRSAFGAYRLQGRGGRGVINLRTTAKTGEVVGLRSVLESDELMMITAGGQVVRTRVESLRIIGRATQGVRLIRLKDDDKLVSVARLIDDGLDDEEESDLEPDAEPETDGDVTPADEDPADEAS